MQRKMLEQIKNVWSYGHSNNTKEHRMSHEERVKEFMIKANQELPNAPTIPDEATSKLRCALSVEEVFEMVDGFGFSIIDTETGNILQFEHLSFEKTHDADLVAIVDGCADVSVVNTGAVIACGVQDFEQVLVEVDNNNLAKFGPGGYEHPDTGKWIKPPDHKAPDIVGVLVAQGYSE